MSRIFNNLGVDIAQLLNKHLGSSLLPCTLTRYTAGARTTSTSGRSQTVSTSTAKGFVEDYDESHVDDTIVQRGDRKVVVLGDSISPTVTPEQGDLVTIEGGQYKVVRVMRDPAEATYVLQCRAS